MRHTSGQKDTPSKTRRVTEGGGTAKDLLWESTSVESGATEGNVDTFRPLSTG